MSETNSVSAIIKDMVREHKIQQQKYESQIHDQEKYSSGHEQNSK